MKMSTETCPFTQRHKWLSETENFVANKPTFSDNCFYNIVIQEIIMAIENVSFIFDVLIMWILYLRVQ